MRLVVENIDFSNKYHLFHYLGNVELLLNIFPTFEDYWFYYGKCNASTFWGKADWDERMNQMNSFILNHCHNAFESLKKTSGKKFTEPNVHLRRFGDTVNPHNYAKEGAAIGLAVGMMETAIFGVFGLAIGFAAGSLIKKKDNYNQNYDKFKSIAFCNAIDAAKAYAEVMQPIVDELQFKYLDDEQKELLNYLKRRNITTLIHVTDRDNIRSIMNLGLLQNNELERRKIEYFRPDKNRFDGYPNYISMSISNRNDILIKKYKEEKRIIEDQLIQIDSSVLVLNKTKRIYCDRNASASTCKKGSEIKDFENCFAESISYATTNNEFDYRREVMGLTDNMPTDPQSEILFGGPIDKHFLWTSSIPDFTRKEAEAFKAKNGRYPWEPNPDDDDIAF